MPRKTPQRYDIVLIEQLHSKMDTVIEGMSVMETRINKHMDERFAQQDARFDVIEGVLHQHSMRFFRIEDRLGRLELKFDDLSETVKRHDCELKSLHA